MVGFFIWAIGVAASNAWKMYDLMYERQKKSSHGNLPPKWSHLEFLEQLVYDLLSPRACGDHVTTLRSMDDGNYHASVRSTKTLSVFSGHNSRLYDHEEWDFTCDSGIQSYNEKVRVDRITKNRLETGFFYRRFDGALHPTIPTGHNAYCQFCAYNYSNVLSPTEQIAFGEQKKNRKQVRRCLTCNVYLCNNCENEFHGIDMTNATAV